VVSAERLQTSVEADLLAVVLSEDGLAVMLLRPR